MNELSSSSESGASAGSQTHSPPPQAETVAPVARPETAPRTGRTHRAVYIGFGLLALLLAGQWWTSHTQVNDLRQEMAQRLRTSDTLNNETQFALKSVQEGVRDLQAKANVLEGKQSEAHSQQLALEQLYQDFLKNQDDWALAEIEQVLSTASQQLQLAGNVQGALIALQNADSRLAGADKPQFINIRRAIANDMEKLKALPSVDLTGISLRLDSAISQVDALPLLSNEKPIEPVTQPKNSRRAQNNPGNASAASGTPENDWVATLQDTWHSWSSEMWTEIRQLLQIRNVESPDVLLLSPTQAYYARENLKLRLLNARLALLTRNEAAFRSDLSAAQDAIAKYFDTRAKQTQTVQVLLRQVQASNVSIDLPTLAGSLNAVRNYKAKP